MESTSVYQESNTFTLHSSNTINSIPFEKTRSTHMYLPTYYIILQRANDATQDR